MITQASDMPISQPIGGAAFVAINAIRCRPEYRARFEELFQSRKRAIDLMPGFLEMEVLKPRGDNLDEAYLVVSYWSSEEAFRSWTSSPEFIEGHRRGFDDLRETRANGLPEPMTSEFRTYDILCR